MNRTVEKGPGESPGEGTTYANVARRWRNAVLLLLFRPHRLIAIAWWRICGKNLRARYRLEDAIRTLPFAHRRWVHDSGMDDLAYIRAASTAKTPPTICVHLHISSASPSRADRRTVASVLRQSLAPLRFFITRADSAIPVPFSAKAGITVISGTFTTRMDGLRAALEAADDLGGDYLVPLTQDIVLLRHSLCAYQAALIRRLEGSSSPALLYSDQQEHSRPWKRPRVWLKPEWDPRMILSQDYLSRSSALPVLAALETLSDKAEPSPRTLYELILRIAHNTPSPAVEHVPRCTVQTKAGDWHDYGLKKLSAVERVVTDAAQITAGPFATVRLQWPMPARPPKVSILVATRDKVELLRTCVDGVLNETAYPDIELIIADNDSREADALRFMDSLSNDPRVRVVRWPHPFNYSAINNYAAGFATGEFLCLLNNDIEIIGEEWLSELVREAVRPGIGAVGARLLYPDHSIQHAGVAIGLGNAAGHAHRNLPEGEPGYYAQALIARGASAVTGACLLVAKRHFEAVGGLDEEGLAVAYNDVDLCMKLQERGLANIYTPAATLIHHESKSRGLDFAPEHLARYRRELAVFQNRWSTCEVVDPWHHPALDRASEIYRKAK